MTWIQTLKGNAFEIFNPQPSDFDIEEIAHALAMQCRFNGHVRHFYSVAEHSVHVSRLLEEWGEPIDIAFAGLLHDASEAYIGDEVRPIKRENKFFQDIEFDVEIALAKRFSLPSPMPDVVKEADATMLFVERDSLMGDPPKPWGGFSFARVPDWRITGELDWRQAERIFLARFNELTQRLSDELVREIDEPRPNSPEDLGFR